MVDWAKLKFEVEKSMQTVPGTNFLKQGVSLAHDRNQKQPFWGVDEMVFFFF